MLNNNIKKLIAIVLVMIGGVVFIIFGSITAKQMKTFIKVPAVVSHISREWTPDGDGGETEEIKIFVTYTVDGQEYTEELNNTKTNLKEGENITVLYNPEDPTEVSGASKGGVALQIGFGSLFLLGGLASLAALIIKGR